MPDLSNELAAIQVATTGSAIRSAIINALSVLNDYIPSNYYSGSYTITPGASSISIPTESKIMYSDLVVEAFPVYSGSYIITPGSSSQTMSVSGLAMLADVMIQAVPFYSGSYSVDPSTVSQTFPMSNLMMESDFVVNAIPSYSGSYVITPVAESQVLSVSRLFMMSDLVINSVSTSYSTYSGPYEITPSTVSQTFPVANLLMTSDLTIGSYSASGGDPKYSSCYWCVNYYDKTGSALFYKEYVANGEDAIWGSSHSWASMPNTSSATSGILEDIDNNTNVYNISDSLLLYSDLNDILVEADGDTYQSGSSIWGGWTISGYSDVTKDNSGFINLPLTAQAYLDLGESNQATTIYALIRNHTGGSGVNWPVLIGEVYSETTGNAPRFAVNASSQLAYSVWGTDASAGVTALETWYLLAMSLDQSTKKCKFFVNGSLVGIQSFSTSGSKVHVSGSVNNSSTGLRTNMDVYYAAVVSGSESDSIVIANSQNILTHYGISN